MKSTASEPGLTLLLIDVFHTNECEFLNKIIRGLAPLNQHHAQNPALRVMPFVYFFNFSFGVKQWNQIPHC